VALFDRLQTGRRAVVRHEESHLTGADGINHPRYLEPLLGGVPPEELDLPLDNVAGLVVVSDG